MFICFTNAVQVPSHPGRASSPCSRSDSGGVVNSLDFCPASLKSWLLLQYWLLLLPVHTFFTMEGGDSEFATFTLPTLKAFFEAGSHNVSGNKQ